jgi:hypothetical protein
VLEKKISCSIFKDNCRPQSDHVKRSDLAKRFFIASPGRRKPSGGGREAREQERRAGA